MPLSQRRAALNEAKRKLALIHKRQRGWLVAIKLQQSNTAWFKIAGPKLAEWETLRQRTQGAGCVSWVLPQRRPREHCL